MNEEQNMGSEMTSAEPTAASDSPAEAQSSEPQNVPSDDQSSEDSNTRSDVNSSEGEEMTGESKNRFQELANENRDLREKVSLQEQEARQRAEAAQRLQQRTEQAYAQGQQVDPRAREALTNYRLQVIQEEQEFDKASRIHPELDKYSDSYDKEFHDLVYSTRKGSSDRYGQPSMDYNEAAQLVKKQLAKAESRARAKAESDIDNKTSSSVGSRPRSEQPSAGNDKQGDIAKARARFMKSGKQEDLVALRRLQRS